MHFTVVFHSHESQDDSYGLVFVPCPVWVRGDEELLNLHPENPHYVKGDLLPLLERKAANDDVPSVQKKAVVVVHSTGHGTSEDLHLLVQDLDDAGFRPMTIRLDQSV